MERFFSDVVQEIHETKKSGALFINVIETSEDLLRIYFRDGEIEHLCYGAAIGHDCMEIIEYYALGKATFFSGLAAPAVATAKVPTGEFISLIRRNRQKVRMTPSR